MAIPPADLNFKSKMRPCGKCGREFKTTPTRRYHCARCRSKIREQNLSETELC